MKIIKTVQEMQKTADKLRRDGKTIGFVPTMGYLHKGHLSLIQIARRHADVVVLSIYVNPMQFGANEDLDAYPRDFKRDEDLAKNEKVDIVFYPDNQQMYPEGFKTSVLVEGLSQKLCGASRPVHFQGVTTICTKLFNIIQPHFAVFGEKDYQQAVIIRRMVRDLNMNLRIIEGPIVRDADGLALSSRNTYLSIQEREDALILYRSLTLAEELIRRGEQSSEKLLIAVRNMIESKEAASIDYVRVIDPETLEPVNHIRGEVILAMAVYIGKIRLIDNCRLGSSE